jgi:putative transcriptional regulator
MHHYIDCGLDYIYLLNGYEIINDFELGECISIHNVEGLHRQIAKDIIDKAPLMRGQEARFFRSELKLTQTQMSILLGTDLRTIQRWETDKRSDAIPSMADKLIRLFYTAHTEENKVAKKMCESLKIVHDFMDDIKSIRRKNSLMNAENKKFFKRLNFADTGKGWQPKMAA